jgi:septation ring formation regulator EzrA
MAEVLGPTLEGYLNTNPEVKSAREQLAKAKKALDDVNAALTGSRNATQEVRNDLKAIQSRAQKDFDTLRSLANEAQKVATDYFKTNYQDISLSSFDKSIEGLEVAKLKLAVLKQQPVFSHKLMHLLRLVKLLEFIKNLLKKLLNLVKL